MSLNIAERQPLLHRNPSRNQRSARLAPQPTFHSSSTSPNNNSRRHVYRTRIASAAILLSLVFERIAFYGLAGNLVLFLNKDPFKWESYHAINASLYFFGLCFATSFIGGWLADSFLGRFKTLVISFVIYVAGYVLMPVMSPKSPPSITIWDQNKTISLPAICKVGDDHDGDNADTDPFDERCAWLVFVALLIIAVGTGFVKANIAPFGSDQVSGEGQQATLSFFNWFYWSINLGALLGLSVITYLQQQQSFFVGYLVSTSCLGLAAILFVAGRCFYQVRQPDGSVLSNVFRIICEAYRQKRRHQQAVKRRAANLLRGGRSREIDEADPLENRRNFLDNAKHRYGGIFHDSIVEDVRQLKKILAVFAVLIPYWLVYFQMQTTFLIQGLHMRLMMTPSARDPMPTMLPINGSTFNNVTTEKDHPQLVAAWFALFDVVILVFLLPLFDRVIYPWIERRSGHPVGISWRILLGMVFAAVAMVVAGVLEHYRLKTFWPFPKEPCRNASINQMIGYTVFEAADMSILWQIPQYALIGLSEVFTSVAGLQFAVSVAPRSMKGIIMGLFYLFSGIGSFLGTTIIISLSTSNVWFHSLDYGNINCRLPCKTKEGTVKQSCHLDYYFFLLAGIEAMGALLFLLVARAYRLDELHRQSRGSRPAPEASGDSSSLLLPAPNHPFQSGSIQRDQHGQALDNLLTCVMLR
ncbi:solute carrier family 15 member 4-like [Babylonia areolata]|uniref:solute carrier family 15 member 4-like n=1 Tax=Babylonia areolata TaxID=304850 RepID=UPI003FD5EC50